MPSWGATSHAGWSGICSAGSQSYPETRAQRYFLTNGLSVMYLNYRNIVPHIGTHNVDVWVTLIATRLHP